MKKILPFCIAILAMAAALPASAQNYQQLRQAIMQQQQETRSEIDHIDDLINQYQRRLNQAEQKYGEIYKQYENLQRLLALQRQKISTLEKERNQITEEITVTERKLEQQEQKLESLIEDYKSTMRYLYKNGRTSQMAVILSSQSVNQMMVRNYYLKKFETYREKQAAEIKQTQNELKESRAQLDEAAQRNKNILAEIETEEQDLQKRTNQQQSNVKLLRQDKQEIAGKLEESQQQKQELETTLSDLIAQEEAYREAERKRRQQEQENLASNNDASGNEPPAEANTPEERSLGGNTEFVGEVGYISDDRLAEIESSFATQKGQLEWPVQGPTISEKFGRRRHPVLGTVTPNLGIEIVTQSREEVHVVHDGYVFAVRPLTGYGDVVFVKHGKYITAYGNLSRVVVRKNTILEKGQLVGYAGDQNSTRGESVFFMLRNGNQNVDPEAWLKNK